jgi:hypothetical protein
MECEAIWQLNAGSGCWEQSQLAKAGSRSRYRALPMTGGQVLGCTREETVVVDAGAFTTTFFFGFAAADSPSLFRFLVESGAMAILVGNADISAGRL